MKKVVLSVVAALAVGGLAAPAVAADMPVKAKMAEPAPPPSPFDIAFGVAFTTDYMLRGYSQSDNQPAIQGYFEPSYKINDMISLYAGLWGSSLWTGAANAEFDAYGGVRFSIDKFGLDVGYVHYIYPDGAANGFNDYGEIYAKPSFSITDWLSIGAIVYYAPDINQSGTKATYYAGTASVKLPQFMPLGISTSISGEVGRQVVEAAFGNSWTTWNVGVAFAYKAITLDVRYWDSDVDPATCVNSTGRVTCDERVVATLKFDTSLSALK